MSYRRGEIIQDDVDVMNDFGKPGNGGERDEQMAVGEQLMMQMLVF